jgi:hypothetical protein
MTALSRPLIRTAWINAGLAILFVGLLVADPRLVDGAPAWLKPLKFAVSIAIYSATFAWILRALTAWPRLAQRAATITAVTLMTEVVLIGMQAGRGTTSHFNTSSLFDGAVFTVMGLAIGLQTLMALAVTIALFRQPFTDRALGWALRLGMALTVVGASTGGLMTSPSTAQIEQFKTTGAMPRAGGHTVGAPDGGPGLPGTGWSTAHGDLRAPHFLGLHAMQALPLVALLLTGVRRERARVVAVIGVSASYAALFTILLVQALAGESIAAPSAGTVSALGAWAALSIGVAIATWRVASASTTMDARTAMEVA